MKRSSLLKMLFISLLVLVLAACGGNDSQGEDSGDTGDAGEAKGDSKYPEKTISLIVPYAAGGTTDMTARAIANVISDYLPNNTTMAVVNKEGGAGVIGMTEIANAKPDGYTLGLATSGPMTIAPHTQDTSYDLDSFEYISLAVKTPNVVFVKADSPWETYEDLIEYAKENPGEVTYGTSGAGNSQHISMEALSAGAGVELTHVPYEGGAPAITAALGGHIDVTVNQSTEGTPHVESGELRGLVNVGSFATKGLEDVPLLSEKGVDVALDPWNAVVAPAGVPEDIIEILVEAFEKALADERVIDQLDSLGVEPTFEPTDQFRQTAEETYEMHREVLEDIGLAK